MSHRLIAVTRKESGPSLIETLQPWNDNGIMHKPGSKFDHFREIGYIEVSEVTSTFMNIMEITGYVTSTGEWHDRKDLTTGSYDPDFDRLVEADLASVEDQNDHVTHLVMIHN